MNLVCEVAFLTHIWERGVVPNVELYSISDLRGALTGTPWIYPVCEAAGIRSKASCLRGTVHQIDHAGLLFLDNIYSGRRFLGIGWPVQSGCSRVHASDQPFVAFLFQCRDILIPGIYKDSFLKTIVSGIVWIYF